MPVSVCSVRLKSIHEDECIVGPPVGLLHRVPRRGSISQPLINITTSRHERGPSLTKLCNQCGMAMKAIGVHFLLFFKYKCMKEWMVVSKGVYCTVNAVDNRRIKEACD